MRIIFSLLFSLLFVVNVFAQSRKDIKTADLLFERERYLEASGYYKKALIKYKDDVYLNLQMAICCAKVGDVKMAGAYFQIAKEQHKGDWTHSMHYTQAEIYQLLHQFTKAKRHYKLSDPFNARKRLVSKKILECKYGEHFMKKKKKGVVIKNIGGVINSPYHDVLPKPNADFSVLYFTSQRARAVGAVNPEDVYQSYSLGGWSRPKLLSKPINTESNDACIGVSPDGQTMYLFRGTNGGDIYFSELDGDKWTEPQPMPFNTPERETSLSISPDGKTLYFVRKTITKKGGDSNIYYCRKNAGGRWSKPSKMSTVNTRYDEESPFIHPDGKTLYFSSKGHSSMGGFDVFKTIYNKETKTWSKPKNLGYPINTANDEFSFVLSADGRIGMYASIKKEGFGGQDIYTIRMPVSKKKPALTLLKGHVKNAVTNQSIEANITITDNEKNEVVAKFKSNGSTGEYMVSLPAGKNYGISIEKEGHLFHSENVYLDATKGFEKQVKEITLVNAKKGAKVVLNNIFFASGSFELSQTSYAELQRLAKLLKKYPQLKVEIGGHTDNVGDANVNVSLSQKRANAVVEYLLKNGVAKTRLVAKGYGSSRPVAPNTTEKGRQENRRIEFKIL
ncbi:MAG: OmpA family protein [Cytophagales bacterium]|nr:OmpA family protein [Cytophagales bacterium]